MRSASMSKIRCKQLVRWAGRVVLALLAVGVLVLAHWWVLAG